MILNSQKEFFLVRNVDTDATKCFHLWRSVVDFLTDDIMEKGYCIIYDESDPDTSWLSDWRAPKNREECFNLLFNVEDIMDLNSILEDLWHTEIIEFSD